MQGHKIWDLEFFLRHGQFLPRPGSSHVSYRVCVGRAVGVSGEEALDTEYTETPRLLSPWKDRQRTKPDGVVSPGFVGEAGLCGA